MKLLFTMHDVESGWARFAEPTKLASSTMRARKTRSSAAGEVEEAGKVTAIKSSKYRPVAAGEVNPFEKAIKPSVAEGIVIKDAERANPTFLRKTRRGGIAIVKKGQRKASRAISGAIDRATTPGVKAGYKNISHGLGQIADDAGLAIRKRGVAAVEHVGAHAGKYAGAAAALAAVGGGAYVLNKNKQASMSRYSHGITFSRRSR